MYQIRRLLISRAGHSEAWYDGVVLPFVSRFTGRCSSTAISLVNGGGKSTALALMASCFVPDKKRFIQRLQKGYHFDEYFTAIPGAIAVELEAGTGDLFGGTTQLVVGQVVTRRGPRETEREFFLFYPQAPLCFDTLPFKGAPEMPEPQWLDRWEQVRAWLRRMRETIPGFEFTGSQIEWKRLLEAAGLDPWLVDSQIEMNREEGGIDQFVKFETEEHFLYRFFEMVDRREGNASVCEALNKSLYERRNFSKRKRQAECLDRLHEALTGFDRVAGGYRAVVARHRQNERDVLAVALGLEARMDAERARAEGLAREVEAKQSALNEAKAQSAASHATYCSLALHRLGRRLAEAKTDADQARRRRDDACRRLQALRAAEALSRYRQKNQELEDKRVLLESESRELRPLEERLKEVGLRVRRAIATRREVAEGERKRAGEAIEKLGKEVEEQQAALRSLQRDAERHETTVTASRTRLEQYDAALQRLRAAGVISAGLTPREAHAVLNEQLDAANERIGQQESVLEELDRHREAARDTQTKCTQDRIAAAQSLKTARESLAEAESAREALTSDADLAALLAREEFEPDEDAVASRLQSVLVRRRRDRDRLEQDRDRLTAESAHIDAHGLAPPDPDTQRAHEALQEAGVEGVSQYAAYLASGVAENAEHARTIVRSDPARYLGLGVHSREELARIYALNLTGTGLTKPVVVSLLSDRFDEAPGERAVLGPEHDARYDHAAAAWLQESIGKRLDDLNADIEALEERIGELEALEVRIGDYRRRFGGWLERLRSGVRDTEAAFTAAQEAEERVKVQIDELQRHMCEVDTTLKEQRTVLGQLEICRARIQEFLCGHEDDLEANQHALAQAKEALADVDWRREKVNGALDALEEQIKFEERTEGSAKKQLRELKDREDDFPERLDDESILAPEDLSLDALEALYRDRRQTLDAARAERGFGDLIETVKRLEEEAGKARREFRRELDDLVEERDAETLLDVDWRAARERAEQDKETAVRDETKAIQRAKRIEGEDIPAFRAEHGLTEDSAPADAEITALDQETLEARERSLRTRHQEDAARV